MNPVRMRQVRDIAFAGEVLPKIHRLLPQAAKWPHNLCAGVKQRGELCAASRRPSPGTSRPCNRSVRNRDFLRVYAPFLQLTGRKTRNQRRQLLSGARTQWRQSPGPARSLRAWSGQHQGQRTPLEIPQTTTWKASSQRENQRPVHGSNYDLPSGLFAGQQRGLVPLSVPGNAPAWRFNQNSRRLFIGNVGRAFRRRVSKTTPPKLVINTYRSPSEPEHRHRTRRIAHGLQP